MAEIDKHMTVAEAMQHRSPGIKVNLALWADAFRIRLDEFELRHIEEYRSLLREPWVHRHQINCEVESLLDLLESADCGEVLRSEYQPLEDPDVLPANERAALSERARVYVAKLEARIEELRHENRSVGDRLRKANWARWKR